MPVIAHPYYDPIEPLDMSKPVQGVTVNAALRSGVDAKVILMGRPKAPPPGLVREWWPEWFSDTPDNTAARPVLFRVQVRAMLPGPELGPRDRQVTEWIRAHGWELALEAAERRWFELRDSGELQKQAQAVDRTEAVESERRRAEDAQRPGFFDELYNAAGQAAGGIYNAAAATVAEVAETAKTAFSVLKWGFIGTAAVVGVVTVARLTRKRKRHG